MVDPVNPTGPIQGANNIRKSNDTLKQVRAEGTASSDPVDEVSISEEALSLTQAEQAANQAREALANNTEQVLSADAERLNALI